MECGKNVARVALVGAALLATPLIIEADKYITAKLDEYRSETSKQAKIAGLRNRINKWENINCCNDCEENLPPEVKAAKERLRKLLGLNEETKHQD